jgi:hypothetical protein
MSVAKFKPTRAKVASTTPGRSQARHRGHSYGVGSMAQTGVTESCAQAGPRVLMIIVALAIALFERRHQKSDLTTVGRHKC